jgi:hypothetical protein
MTYSLCKFEYGYQGTFYMICSGGQVIRYVDMDGNTLDLTPPYGYNVIVSEAPLPTWA